ncbi:MAG: ferritin-like domain-containing protein [Actinobacteria bacterium]|nr:ferritin-like domain-containing protein [Actinomycetota bacterium]
MSQSERKIVQYLGEAHASEMGLTRVLQAQIAATPTGTFRTMLEKHLTETKRHAERLRSRIDNLDEGGFRPLSIGIGMAETLISQVLAVGKAPIDLLRGSGGEEKVLKNAKDDCAAEALEIATYTALERLADAAGDLETAKLATSILADEERMLKRLLAEIPKLTTAVADAALRGDPSYDITKTGAADAARTAARTVKDTVDSGVTETKRTARQARRVPGVAQVEGEIKGALAGEADLPIDDYDDLTAAEIVDKLPGLSQIDLAKIDAYERKHQNRTTVLSKLAAGRGNEPWPGYDEQTVEEIEKVLAKIDDEPKLREVRSYEEAHKNRSTLLRATERELAHAGS